MFVQIISDKPTLFTGGLIIIEIFTLIINQYYEQFDHTFWLGNSFVIFRYSFFYTLRHPSENLYFWHQSQSHFISLFVSINWKYDCVSCLQWRPAANCVMLSCCHFAYTVVICTTNIFLRIFYLSFLFSSQFQSNLVNKHIHPPLSRQPLISF